VLDVWGCGEGEEEWVVDEGAEEEEEVSVGGKRGRGEGGGVREVRAPNGVVCG